MDSTTKKETFKHHQNDASRPIQRPKSLTTHPPVVATIVAKAVTVSKLENNELTAIGKYGFALAGDVKLNYYQLLLYGSKNSILANLILTKDFKYNVNENNTVEFFSKDNWHLEFSSTNDAVDFNSHLAFVLWKLNGYKELFWFDLYYPSRNDNVAMFGSVVEIIYVANTIQGNKIGPEVSNNIEDSQYLKVNVNQDGWERSLLGVNNNTQRIIYIPFAEMGAWKILTNGRQCLCLTVTVKNVYEIKENVINDFPEDVINDFSENVSQESISVAPKNNSSLAQTKDIFQAKDIIEDNQTDQIIAPLRSVCIESLYEEFEKFKLDSIKTNDRLTKLEALVIEKPNKIENSNELKKSMKILYKSIAREFPVDQTFSGSQIQTIIQNIFYNTLMSTNQSHSKND
ncbi:FK506-binding protein 15-like [Melanaphis sacchari]|uniref:FK506-binding protein 5 n=1 Tax=Melanaphis sacchari TaxID=742174 RepID=A0A2H8TIV3_9HEMI|nr:FK506-binding protein 15-like [Melanaphis sacchari]